MENYFEELIRLMELLDNNKEIMEQDDTTIPSEVMAEFNNDSNYYTDISILESLIDNTLAIPFFLRNQLYKKPTGVELHNARLKALRGNYMAIYLPILHDFGRGETLSDGSDI